MPSADRGFLKKPSWLKLFMAATCVGLMGLSNPAVAAAVNEDGSIAGLKPKFIDVQGVRTRYYEYGKGEPMLLLHGEGWSGHSSGNTWSKVIPALAKRYHVFAPDKLASGLTGNPLTDDGYTQQGEVEHMYQFMQAVKMGPAHVIGQSRGGGLAFFLTYMHPEVTRTLVIIDSNTAAPNMGATTREAAIGVCPQDPEWEEWKCRLKAISHLPDVAFDDEFFDTGIWMAQQPKSLETVAKIRAGAGNPRRADFNDWKKMVHRRILNEGLFPMPVLLYWGRHDPSATVRNGLGLYDILSQKNDDVRMLIVNRAGHFHYREYPEEFVQNIFNFLDQWGDKHTPKPRVVARAGGGG